MSLTKVTYSMINGISINVKDYGATGDGTTDDAAAIQAAVDAAIAQQINQVLAGTPVTMNGGPSVYFPVGVYRVNTQISAGTVGYLSLVGDGKSAIIGNPSLTRGVDFLVGTKIRYFNVSGLQFQNFNTVLTVSTTNADLSLWNIELCQAAGVNLFLDTVSYDLSRSTTVSIRDCVFEYRMKQVARIFCDNVTFSNCWFGSTDESTDTIYANSNLSFYGCMFVPPGTGTVSGRCWIKLTNDNGAGGTANDVNRGVVVNGCRISNEGGQGPLVVCDYPVVNTVTVITPSIKIQGCDLVAYQPVPYEAGNSESGVVYLLQYPGSVSYEQCGFANVGSDNSKVVAKSDSLTSDAPVSFGIYMDEQSFNTATRTAGVTAGATIATSMRQYINNPDPYTFRDILEGGYLNVVDTGTVGAKKSIFTLNGGYNDVNYLNPTAFYLYLGGQGTTGTASPNDFGYAGASVYLVTMSGYFSGSSQVKLSYTKLHGDTFGNGSNANCDINNLYFLNTTTSSAPRAQSYEIVVDFGTNVNYGKARIEPAFVKYSRYGLQPN